MPEEDEHSTLDFYSYSSTGNLEFSLKVGNTKSPYHIQWIDKAMDGFLVYRVQDKNKSTYGWRSLAKYVDCRKWPPKASSKQVIFAKHVITWNIGRKVY